LFFFFLVVFARNWEQPLMFMPGLARSDSGAATSIARMAYQPVAAALTPIASSLPDSIVTRNSIPCSALKGVDWI